MTAELKQAESEQKCPMCLKKIGMGKIRLQEFGNGFSVVWMPICFTCSELIEVQRNGNQVVTAGTTASTV